MKKSDLFFTAVRVPIDFLMLMAAGLTAYFLRFQTFSDIRPVILEIPLTDYIFYTSLAALFSLLVYTISGLYTVGFRHFARETALIFTASSASIMAIVMFIFFKRDLFTSRFIILAVWGLSILFVILGRFLLRVIRYAVLRKGIGAHYVAVIGSGRNVERIISDIKSYPTLGFKLAETFEQLSDSTFTLLDELLAKDMLDEIILVDPALNHTSFQRILDYADEKHLTLRYSADVIGEKNLEIGTIAGIPMVEIKRTKLEGWGRIFKRLFDVIVSLILIVIALPIMLLIALAIRLESKGPAIYKNQRVGQRKLFNTYKFRSMYMEYCTGPGYDTSGKASKVEDTLVSERSERSGPVFKILNDPRRTKVGRFLERTSLDELPQFFNVLLGNMSLVGPRPHMPKEVAGYKTHHHKLFSVKPGVTGMAQISGRSDLDFEDEARLDLYYIENWNPWLDLVILLKTPLAVLFRKSKV